MVRALKLRQGRFYNPEDEMQRARVAGSLQKRRKNRFPGRNALGEHIALTPQFEVTVF